MLGTEASRRETARTGGAVSYAVCRDCFAAQESAVAACAACGSGRLVAHAELAELGIAHIDCDAFYASVEKRDDPSLEDRPLIVGHAGGRGVVTTACYLARISGVRSAMPMFQALELCPDAVVLPPDMAKYKRVSTAIRDIFLFPFGYQGDVTYIHPAAWPEVRRWGRLLLAFYAVALFVTPTGPNGELSISNFTAGNLYYFLVDPRQRHRVPLEYDLHLHLAA